jgi:hypothetical protein
MQRRRRFVVALLVAALSTTFLFAGGLPFPNGDYGDAPDCPAVWKGFPTRYDTDHGRFGWPGAHHLIIGEESMRVVTAETGASDPFDPDGEPNIGDCPGFPADRDAADDGVRFMDATPYFQPFVTTASAQWWAAVVITIAPTAPPGPRYLNVVSDVDGDGRWKNHLFATEWVVRNARIDLPPGSSEVMRVTVGVHPFGKGPVWTRFTLSRDPVPLNTVSLDAGWDGSGQFNYGETEDYLVDAGAPLDPTALPPGYNLDIPLPPVCRTFFGANCEPDTAGNCSHSDAIPHGNLAEIHFRVRARSHPLNPPGACFVTWDKEERSQALFGIQTGVIDDADIGAPKDIAGDPVPIPPQPPAPPTPLGNVTPAGEEFHIIYDVASGVDGPPRWESRRIQNDFSFFCCGAFQGGKQESCAVAIVHDGGLAGGDLNFGLGGGVIHDPLAEFGFDVVSPETNGFVRVSRQIFDVHHPNDIPYMQGTYLHKVWFLFGNVAPLAGSDDPPNTTRITRYRFDFTDADLLNAGIPLAQKNQLVVGRLDHANIGMMKWTLDVGSAVVVDPVNTFVRVDNPKSFGQWAIGLPSAFSPADPGIVGSSVRIDKVAGGNIRLSWLPSCAVESVQHGIYQGVIGNWTNPIPLDCDDSNGDGLEVVTPGPGNRYYLVVPLSADVEGSYGTRSNLIERPRGVSTCRAVQMFGTCSTATTTAMELRPVVSDVAESAKESCP